MRSRNSGLRGSGLGGTSYEIDRGIVAPRRLVSFWCGHGHETTPSFAHDAPVPDGWECGICGAPAGQDANNTPPVPARTPVAHTPMEYLRMRRSDEEGAQLLAEALAGLRAKRR